MPDEISKLAAKKIMSGLEKQIKRGISTSSLQIQNLKEFLKLNNLANEPSLASSLEKIICSAEFNRQHAQIKNPEYSRLPDKRSYLGRERMKKLQIKVVYDHLFLTESYYRTINISWRFNEEGRLELVNAKVMSRDSEPKGKNDIYHLIKAPMDNPNKAWNSSEIELYSLPEEISCVNEGFYYLSTEEQYNKLALFGHKLSRNVFKSLQEGTLIDPQFALDDGQYAISQLKDDDFATSILRKASFLVPTTRILSKKNGRLTYKKSEYFPKHL